MDHSGCWRTIVVSSNDQPHKPTESSSRTTRPKPGNGGQLALCSYEPEYEQGRPLIRFHAGCRFTWEQERERRVHERPNAAAS